MAGLIDAAFLAGYKDEITIISIEKKVTNLISDILTIAGISDR